MRSPATQRGRETRLRVVAAAAGLMYEHGVSAVSVEDVLAASGTGKSQFYHYFSGKEELVGDVLRHQLALVLEQQKRFELDSWDGIAAWLDGTVHWQRSQQFLGCPLGSIASAVGEQSDSLRVIAADAFAAWESALAEGLKAMRTRGQLQPDADVQALAETTIAILQGGYMLSSLKRDIRPMRHAVAAARRGLDSVAA